MRFVGVQSSNSKGGRMDARAVLRLLVRSDNKEAVLFMDKIYFSSNRDATLEQQVGGVTHTRCPVVQCAFGSAVSVFGDGGGGWRRYVVAIASGWGTRTDDFVFCFCRCSRVV